MNSSTLGPSPKSCLPNTPAGFDKRTYTYGHRNVQGMRQVDWHTVPDRVLTVRLDGSVEYETSDGEVRRVAAGEFVLVEDTHGKGHLSRHSPDAQLVLWISLPNGLDEPL